MTVADAVPAFDVTQTCTYDSLTRLSRASEGGNWSQIYTYDQYGSRAMTTGNGYATIPLVVPLALTEQNAATNRLVSPSL